MITWTTAGCGACVALAPLLVKVRARYPEERLRMLTVELDTKEEALRSALAMAREKRAWDHVALEDGDAAADAYDVRSIPQLFLLDAEARVVALGDSLASSRLIQALDEALGAP